jgi:hypothetical protein
VHIADVGLKVQSMAGADEWRGGMP